MSDFINTIDVLGDDVVAGSIIDRSITEFKDNLVSNVGDYAFRSASSLSAVDLPNATSIGDYAFYYCKALTTADFPLVTSLGSYAFCQCTALTTADFPAVTSIFSNAFDGCSSLATVDFPLVTSISSYAFRYCSKLTTVDFPAVTNIENYAFYNCLMLKALVLRSETLCPLKNTYTLESTPIANGTGYVYVPDALVDSYKAATNWSTYADQIRPLSEYTG